MQAARGEMATRTVVLLSWTWLSDEQQLKLPLLSVENYLLIFIDINMRCLLFV